VAFLRNGTVCVRSLKRTAFNNIQQTKEDPLILKKSKAYVDCIKRERQKASEMYHRFQKDVIKGKIYESRKILKEMNAVDRIEAAVTKRFQMSIQIQGNAPIFNLRIRVIHTGMMPLSHLVLLLEPTSVGYKLDADSIMVRL